MDHLEKTNKKTPNPPKKKQYKKQKNKDNPHTPKPPKQTSYPQKTYTPKHTQKTTN